LIKLLQMIRYTIKLTEEEVSELMDNVNKGSHTSQTFRTACILNLKFKENELSGVTIPIPFEKL